MAEPSTRSLPVLVDDGEIDVFATTLARFREGKVAEKVFTEFRLRHGTYGQRQPDVQMQRIKIPLGRVNADQLDALAEVAEELADGICHVTTRQDIQVHFMDLADAPEAFRRLSRVGITTREACGNTVRNVTGCARSGVCPGEVFDVNPHAQATARFLLRHPDTQDFGRKFKISFSGCAGRPCGLARMHDIGAVAKIENGARGFELWVGGGLGAVPMQAQSLSSFVPEAELLPTAQAIVRVFARLGEKKVRSRARMKFVLDKLGIERFRELVAEERAKLVDDPVWTSAFDEAAHDVEEGPAHPGSPLPDAHRTDPAFAAWLRGNVEGQAQPGYAVVTILLPLGDLTADQMHGLADLCREHLADTVRFTADQNIVLRWVPEGRLRAVYEGLLDLRLADAGARTAANITACPGTDSCKLGIASSRGLAAELRERFQNGLADVGARTDLSIKISGCPNSCGQHHIADIGFSGSSKRKGEGVAPVFQVFLGGSQQGNAERFGLAMGKVAATRVPEVTRALTEVYLDQRRTEDETMAEVFGRLGKKRIAEILEPFAEIPDQASAPELYRDNRQTWDYARSVGVGECAGEVVSQAEFMLEDAERQVFEAGVALEAGEDGGAAEQAFGAMLAAADALLTTKGLLKSDGWDTVDRFRHHFIEYGNGFFPGTASYLFKAAVERENGAREGHDRVRHLVEEANLFVDEANVVYARLAGAQVK